MAILRFLENYKIKCYLLKHVHKIKLKNGIKI